MRIIFFFFHIYFCIQNSNYNLFFHYPQSEINYHYQLFNSKYYFIIQFFLFYSNQYNQFYCLRNELNISKNILLILIIEKFICRFHLIFFKVLSFNFHHLIIGCYIILLIFIFINYFINCFNKLYLSNFMKLIRDIICKYIDK